MPNDDLGSGEFARHRQALAGAGDFLKHLTDLAYDPISVSDGTWITLQTIAGGSLEEVQVLTSVLDRTPGVALPGLMLPRASNARAYDETTLARTCTTVVTQILTAWAGGHKLDYPSIPQFLRLHLGDRVKPGKALAELAHRWPDRTVTLDGEAHPLPNPFGLVFDRPDQLSGDCVAILGKGHGDMHTENVLVREDLGHFWLIDLSRFQDQAPLTQDPVQLTLSIISRTLGLLDEQQRTVLLDVLVEPTGEGSPNLPDWLNALIQGTQRTGPSWIRVHGLVDEWQRATVLSTVACALIFAARPTSPLLNRAWFVRLAARATRVITPRPAAQTPGNRR